MSILNQCQYTHGLHCFDTYAQTSEEQTCIYDCSHWYFKRLFKKKLIKCRLMNEQFYYFESITVWNI